MIGIAYMRNIFVFECSPCKLLTSIDARSSSLSHDMGRTTLSSMLQKCGQFYSRSIILALLMLIGSVENIIPTTLIGAEQSKSPKQAVFKTRAEAEKAAPEFGCSGAHMMGDLWMVCDHHGNPTHNHQH